MNTGGSAVAPRMVTRRWRLVDRIEGDMLGTSIGTKARGRLWRAILAALILLALAPLASASADPPALKITTPTSGSSTSQQQPTLQGTAEDTVDTVVVYIFQGETQVQKLETTPSGEAWGVQAAPLADGAYTAVAQQLDSETLETATSSGVNFTVDTVEPVLSLNPIGPSTNDSTPTLTGSAGELPGDVHQVTVDVYPGSVAAGTPVATGHPSVSGGAWFYTPSALPDGTYTAQAHQEDAAKNRGASGAVTFAIDTTAPAVTLGPVAPVTGSATPSFSGGVGGAPGDNASVTVVVRRVSTGTVAAEGAASVGAGKWSYTSPALTPDGSYTVQAIQRDQAGNEGKSAVATFRVDTVPPALSVTSPKGGETLSSSKVSFSGTTNNASGEPTEVTVEIFTGSSVAGAPAQTLAGARSGSSWTTPSLRLTNGTYTVRAKELDSAGNLGESLSVTFTVASSAPIVTLNELPHYTNDSTPSFAGSAATSEAEQKVTLKIWRGTSTLGSLAAETKASVTGGAWSAGIPEALPEGIYTAQAEQLPGGGNPAGVSGTTTFVVDTTAPVLTMTAPGASSGLETVGGVAGATPGDRRQIAVELFAGANPEGSPVETITVNASGGAWSATIAGLGDGQYTAVAHQSDEAGNSGSSEARTFTVTIPTPATPASPSAPVASFTWVPASPTVGQSVSLVSNSTDASSSINAFAWDVAGAGSFAPGRPGDDHVLRHRGRARRAPSRRRRQRPVERGGEDDRRRHDAAEADAAVSDRANRRLGELVGRQGQAADGAGPVATKVVVSCKGPGLQDQVRKPRRDGVEHEQAQRRRGDAHVQALRARRCAPAPCCRSGSRRRARSASSRASRSAATSCRCASDACLRPASTKPIGVSGVMNGVRDAMYNLRYQWLERAHRRTRRDDARARGGLRVSLLLVFGCFFAIGRCATPAAPCRRRAPSALKRRSGQGAVPARAQRRLADRRSRAGCDRGQAAPSSGAAAAVSEATLRAAAPVQPAPGATAAARTALLRIAGRDRAGRRTGPRSGARQARRADSQPHTKRPPRACGILEGRTQPSSGGSFDSSG